MNFLFVIFISTALIGCVEVAKRKFRLSSAITRRVTHIGAALIAATAALFINQMMLIFVCALFAAIMFLGRRTALFSSIHDVERRTFGDVYLPLGVAICAVIFLPHNVSAFQYGVLVMGISDALAGLIGERFGRHPVTFFGNTKSVEGTLTFFVCTLVLTLLFVPTFGPHVILIAAILTLVEFLLVYGLDNVVLPVLGGFLIQFLIV